jgi:ABC-type multidrug transport system permease subunit
VHADDLVTDGIFSHCRNPLYLGNLLILLGLFVIHNNTWVYVLGIPFFVTAYMAIVAAEEFFLYENFGDDYQRYCDTTNRWLPRINGLNGLASTFNSMTFHWKRVVAKEYSSFSYWVLAAILIMGEEYLYNRLYMDTTFWISFLSILLFANIATFCIARKYKKSGRLAD